jgi:hypothetical protein
VDGAGYGFGDFVQQKGGVFAALEDSVTTRRRTGDTASIPPKNSPAALLILPFFDTVSCPGSLGCII